MGSMRSNDRMLADLVDDGSGKQSYVPSFKAVGADGSAATAATKTDRTIATSTSSQQAAAANPNRKRLIIQNQDAAINVFVNLGAAATTAGGSIRVGPGATLTIEGSTQALNIIAASGTPVVTIWEF